MESSRLARDDLGREQISKQVVTYDFAVELKKLFTLPRSLGLRRGNMSCPSHAGLRLLLRGFARHRGNADEMIASGALNLPARELFVTGEVLLAMRAFKFKFAHGI